MLIQSINPNFILPIVTKMLHAFYGIKRIKVFLVFALLLGAFTQQTYAQYFSFEAGRQRATINFKLFRNMVIVPVHINGRGPFNFILDTGVGQMLITDPALSDSLKLQTQRKIKISGFGEGADIDAFITPELNVTMQGLKSHNVVAAVLKKDIFGLSNYAGVHIHGLLGYEFFSHLAVKVDFTDTTVVVFNSGSFKGFSHGATMPITVEANRPYIQTTITRDDGSQTLSKLIVDLGAGHALTLENVQNKALYSPKFIADGNLGFGIKGVINGSVGRIKALDLGRYKLKDLIVSYPEDRFTSDMSIPRDGNLGIEALKKFTTVFDYAQGVMYLKEGSGFGQPFEHDMSGLEYYASGDDLNHIIIDHVEPGSPADKAGLEKDDEIVSINYKPVSKMSIEQIDELFRSQDSRILIIDVYHDTHFFTLLTLKRRI